ncbi:hypothetical protein [Chryseobacterium sp.]|uniref:hypothetical protein n=1 Tax=Chryseobacterium sp. TaxID=1871047 RepID=UPI0011CA3A3F|nr:hypothetical protein [Chryseobacterium sp.]TXF78851.1 hypothetical protein FUA25_00185 [Chryseobacterium sp.]
MKKFIPIFSLAIGSVFLQNCTNRDEDVISENNQLDEIVKTTMMKGDSTQTSEETVDPDPPVRDGDNWRHVPK